VDAGVSPARFPVVQVALSLLDAFESDETTSLRFEGMGLLPPPVKETGITADKSNDVVRHWYGPFATAHDSGSTHATVRRHHRIWR